MSGARNGERNGVMDVRLALTGGVLAAIAAVGGWALLHDRGEAARAIALESRGDFAGALAIWDAACAREPADLDACIEAGEAHFTAGDLAGAHRALDRAAARAPDDLSVMMLKAALQQAASDADGARTTYLAAAKLHAGSALPAANLASMAAMDGDAVGAERWAEEAVAADPKDPFAQITHARVLSARGDVTGAVAAYGRALEGDGHSFDAALELSDILVARGDYVRAAQLLAGALEQEPDHLRARVAYASALAQLGDSTRAAEVLRAAADLDPKAPAPHIALGEIYLADGRADFAVGRFREALVVDTANLLACQRLAEALQATGATAESTAVLDALLARPGLPPRAIVDGRMLRADLRWRNALADGAREDVAAVLAIDPRHEQANWLAGHMLLEARRYDEARPHVEAALAVESPHPSAVLDHARWLAHAGRTAEAITELTTLARLGQLSIPEVKAQPEFRDLKGERAFMLLLDQAIEPVVP